MPEWVTVYGLDWKFRLPLGTGTSPRWRKLSTPLVERSGWEHEFMRSSRCYTPPYLEKNFGVEVGPVSESGRSLKCYVAGCLKHVRYAAASLVSARNPTRSSLFLLFCTSGKIHYRTNPEPGDSVTQGLNGLWGPCLYPQPHSCWCLVSEDTDTDSLSKPSSIACA